MQIEMKFFSGLQEYLPENSSKNSCRIETSQGNSVEDILHELKIPCQRLSGLLIMANGIHVKLGYVPKNGDVVSVFPAIAGG